MFKETANLYQGIVKINVLDRVGQNLRFYSKSALKNDLIKVSAINCTAPPQKKSMQD